MSQNLLTVCSAAALLLLPTLFPATATAAAAAPGAGSVVVSGVAGVPAAVDPAATRRQELRAAREQLRRRFAPAMSVMP